MPHALRAYQLSGSKSNLGIRCLQAFIARNAVGTGLVRTHTPTHLQQQALLPCRRSQGSGCY
jgi:hypothetical protein